MKTIIELPENSTLVDIEEEFPNRIISYELFGNSLSVITTNCSEVSPELFTLKLLIENVVEEFVFDNTGYTQHTNSHVQLNITMVG